MKPVLLALILASCSATMVNYPGSSGSAYAPMNESARPGMVKYLNQGAGAIVSSRREDAYRKMHTVCRGAYHITGEGPRSEGGFVVEGAYFASQYWYIQFTCATATAPTATAQRWGEPGSALTP